MGVLYNIGGIEISGDSLIKVSLLDGRYCLYEVNDLITEWRKSGIFKDVSDKNALKKILSLHGYEIYDTISPER